MAQMLVPPTGKNAEGAADEKPFDAAEACS
jgi:hypothetical protein